MNKLLFNWEHIILLFIKKESIFLIGYKKKQTAPKIQIDLPRNIESSTVHFPF